MLRYKKCRFEKHTINIEASLNMTRDPARN